MQPEEAMSNYSVLTVWSANPRIQTRFSPEEGVATAVDTSDVVSDPLDTSDNFDTIDDTTIDDTATSPDDAPTSDQTATAPAPSEDDDPEFWDKHLETLPPKRREQLLAIAQERRQLLEDKMRWEQQRAQPTPAATQEYADQRQAQIDDYLAKEHAEQMKAMIAAAKAGEAGDEAAWNKANAKAARHQLNITKIRDQEIVDRMLSIIDSRDRPRQIQTAFESHSDFSDIKDAAPAFAFIQHCLAEGIQLTPEQARDAVAHAAYLSLKGTSKKKSGQTSNVTGEERDRARRRVRVETPDGGGSGGGSQGIWNEKNMDTYIDNILKLNTKKAR